VGGEVGTGVGVGVGAVVEVGEGVEVGVDDGAGVGLGLGDPEGLGEAPGVGVGEAFADALGEGDGETLPVGRGVGVEFAPAVRPGLMKLEKGEVSTPTVPWPGVQAATARPSDRLIAGHHRAGRANGKEEGLFMAPPFRPSTRGCLPDQTVRRPIPQPPRSARS